MGILTSAAGAKLAWWIDPAGAVRPELRRSHAQTCQQLTLFVLS
jgi:hypothetical protein